MLALRCISLRSTEKNDGKMKTSSNRARFRPTGKVRSVYRDARLFLARKGRQKDERRTCTRHTRSHRRRADIIQYNVGPSDIICSRAVSPTRAPINLDSISTKRGFMFSAPPGTPVPSAGNQFLASSFLFRDSPLLSFFSFPFHYTSPSSLSRSTEKSPRRYPRSFFRPVRAICHPFFESRVLRGRLPIVEF